MIVEPPSNMHSGPVRLVFDRFVEVEPGGEFVPFYHFKIANVEGAEVGHINFRVGDTNHVRQYAGHIGYAVLPEHRGNSYAYHACEAIRPFVRSFYDKVILTCNPDNAPSIRTIERLGARFLEEISVPEDDPAFESGSRRKRRYEWEL